MFRDWVERNKDRVSLYFRGKASSSLKLKCPLCGRLLHKLGASGKFECKNGRCKLIHIELRDWEVTFRLEPITNIKYDLRQHFKAGENI
jgi:phage FluMu protein Com